MSWKRSSVCSTDQATGNCVEVLRLSEQVAVRDSKDQGGPILLFTHEEWAVFLAGARAGEFD